MTTTIMESRTPALDRPIMAVIGLTWEKVLYGLLIVAAFVTRFYDLGTRAMSHDESLHTQFGWYLFQGRGFQHSPLMHGVLRFEVTAFTYWLLGDNDFTSRIAPALMGVVAVGLMYYFRRWLGRAGALVAALLMLISPYMLYYARYIRDEPYIVVWALLMVLCVLRYIETRASRYLYWLAAITALFYATMEASYIYIAILMLFLGLHLVRELFAVRWPRPEYRQPFQISFWLTLVAVGVALAFLVVGAGAGTGTGTAVPANPAAAVPTPGATAAAGFQVTLIAGVVAAVGLLAGAYLVIRAFGQEVRRFPALDLLMILGLFVLPQLTAFPVLALGRDPLNYSPPATQGLGLGDALITFFSSDGGITLLVCIFLLAITVVVGALWDWRRFAISAGIFYGIFITLFTTFFTNGGGLASGLIGSLAYWVAQHEVQRGNQPWYYYAVINVPMYEFLPAIGALLAGYIGLRRWLRLDEEAESQTNGPAETLRFPVIGYFGFWSVAALAAFSIAGEKMPWLTTHITLPLILLSGWSIGRIIDRTDWRAFRERRAWLVAALLPVTVVALAATLGSLLGANPPFQGSELNQLQATGVFISAALVSIIGLAALYGLGMQLGFDNVLRLAGLSVLGLLAILTARTAFRAAYINYDYANEFLVYAHGSSGVKEVMGQIEDLSRRLDDGLGMKVAYDSDVAWPMTWYFRDYTRQSYYGDQPTREALDAPVVISGPKHWDKVEALLGNRYYQFEYIRMVWPTQDYFNLDWTRIRNALGSPDYRQALWDIWYDRDYTLFGQLTQKNFDLSEWPVAERMRMYVRKDIASQIWDYGVGPTVLEGEIVPEDPYTEGRQALQAVRAWGSEGTAPGQFQSPRAVAAAPDGSIYVADERNNRIQKFDADGNLALTWGTLGSIDNNTAQAGTFNQPWGVAVGPDGSVYVADTWNHRIQKFDANGQFLTMWGVFGQAETPNAFWGPRAVAVDELGRVYVADTGNKRIVVFDDQGNFVNAIGFGGSDPGQLDEPVGLAVTGDGTVFVADTWNQRIQVFEWDSANGEFAYVREWPIVGWYGQSLENKPYVAADVQGNVYVTDPEGYRVLVFGSDGRFLTTWGDFGSDMGTFALLSGIAVDAQGNVYVSDAGNQRLMKFPPAVAQ
jgi:predicted membrane-bound mannosyltransferase/DNA-binding beta-propeller fold protein YncE